MDPTVAGTGLSEGNEKMDTVIAGTSLSGQELLLETPSSEPVVDTCTEKNEEVLHSGAVGTPLQRENENIGPVVAETRLHEGSVEMDMVNAITNSSGAKKRMRKKRRRTGAVSSENCCDAGDVSSGHDLLQESNPSSKDVADTRVEKNEEVLHSGAAGTLLERENVNIVPVDAETRLHEGSVAMDMVNARTNLSGAKKHMQKRGRRICAVNSENCCDAGDVLLGHDPLQESNPKIVADASIEKNEEVLHPGGVVTLLLRENVNMDPAVGDAEKCCDAGDVLSTHDLLQESNPSSKDVANACIVKNEEVLHSGTVGTLLQRENVSIDPARADTRLHEGSVEMDTGNAGTNVSGAKKRRRKRGRGWLIYDVNSENCCDVGDVLSGHDHLQESNPSYKDVADTCIGKNEEVLHSGAVVSSLQRENINMDPAVGDVENCCDAGDALSTHDLLQESYPSSKDVANACIVKNEEVLHSGTVGTLLQRENISIDPARADTRLHEGSVKMDTGNAGTNVAGAKRRRRKRGRGWLIYDVNSENCCDVGDVLSGHDMLQESNPSSKDVADKRIEKNEVVLLSGAVGTSLEIENVDMDPEVVGTRLHEGNMEMETIIARKIPPEAKRRRRKKLRQICAANSKNCCDVAGVLTGQDIVLESSPSSKHVGDTFIKKNEEVLHTESVGTLLQNESMEVDPPVSKTFSPMNNCESVMATDGNCDAFLHSGSANIIFPETNTERGPTIEETSFSTGNIDINPTADASMMDRSSVDAKQESVKLPSGAGGNGSVSDSNINSVALQDSVVLSQPPEGHSKRILLILDINGILADIVPYPIRGANKPDTMISNKALFKRPFCDQFLQFCFERFHVGIWSSRVKSNVDRAVDFLMGPRKHQLLFCWNQSHCTVTGYKTIENRDKPLVLKELRKLWDNEYQDLPWDKGQYNETNTLLLDDSPYKALRNPLHTGIFPCPYRYRNNIDNSLAPEGRLCRYLVRLSEVENVQKFVKENPIGQKPISEVHDSWSFYAKIVGREVSETEGKEMNGGSNVKTCQTTNPNERKC